MTTRLSTLYALEEALTDHLLALDERIATRVRAIPEQPSPPPGMKPLITHTHRPELVYDDPLIIRQAFSRDLFWRYRLAKARPTLNSATRAIQRLQGWALYHLARKRELAGQPLPLKAPHTHVPAYALSALPGRAKATRTVLPDTTRDETSAGAFWERYGDAASLQMTRQEWDALVREFGLPEFSNVGHIFDFDELLALQAEHGLTDLDVLKALDAAWAQSTFTAAGQATLDDAGVVGTFDMVDPYLINFLRQQSGYLISGIDETTRGFVAETLWTFLGGGAEWFQPQNVESVARLLQQFANQWDNDLAGMSRYRAFLISVTETARAESFGSFAAMWQTGVLQKYWMITSGACLICMGNAEAGNIGITESFPGGFQAPPQHPKCRCSLSAYVPQQFNPNEWVPRDISDFDDMLFSNEGGYWPNMDLTSLLETSEIDLDLGDFGRSSEAQETRKRARATRSLDTAALGRFDALGHAFADAADAAMVEWARAAGVRIPTHLTEWKALAQALRSPTERHAAADARYGETLLARLAEAATRAKE
jgi:hypothetical protein